MTTANQFWGKEQNAIIQKVESRGVNVEDILHRKLFLTVSIEVKESTLQDYSVTIRQLIYDSDGYVRSFKTVDFGEQSVYKLNVTINGREFIGAIIGSLKIKRSEEFDKPEMIIRFDIPREGNSDDLWLLGNLIKEEDVKLVVEKLQTELPLDDFDTADDGIPEDAELRILVGEGEDVDVEDIFGDEQEEENG